MVVAKGMARFCRLVMQANRLQQKMPSAYQMLLQGGMDSGKNSIKQPFKKSVVVMVHTNQVTTLLHSRMVE